MTEYESSRTAVFEFVQRTFSTCATDDLNSLTSRQQSKVVEGCDLKAAYMKLATCKEEAESNSPIARNHGLTLGLHCRVAL